ncbi:hypothetical protein RFI_36706, partial [Reticulomyxa filosa]
VVIFIFYDMCKKEEGEVEKHFGVNGFEKHFAIEPYGNEKVIFKAIDLSDKGRMERSKEANWKQLLQIIKDNLKLTDTSTLLFVKKDNPDDQINNEDDLMDLWNEFNKNKTAMYYTLKMRCLLIMKEDKLMTWCPKNSDDPNFHHEMEKEDWSQHFENLRQFVGISTNDEWLSESDQNKKIQSGEDLKVIWAERYKDSDTCCLRLKVISDNISENGENKERMYMNARTKEGEWEEEQTGTRNQSGDKFNADKMIEGEGEEGKIKVPMMEYKQKKAGNMHEFNDDEKKEEAKISHEKSSKMSPVVVKEKEDFDIRLMLELMKKAEKAANEIKDKHVILFLGGTGTGKSTLIHYLAGSTMEKQVVDGKPHIAPTKIINKALTNVICRAGAKSETKYITAVPIDLKKLGVLSIKLNNVVLCDTPGFEDTNGPEVDVANGMGIIKALQTCKNVKPVVLVSYTALGNRMACVRELVRTLVRIIPSIQDYLSAFAYVFTKFPDDQKQSIHATVLDTYESIEEGEKDEGYRALLADIAEKTAKDALAPDLLNDPPQELLKKLADPRNFIERSK